MHKINFPLILFITLLGLNWGALAEEADALLWVGADPHETYDHDDHLWWNDPLWEELWDPDKAEGARASGKVELSCSRRELWLEGEDIKLGRSQECEQGLVYALTEGRGEKFSLSVSHRKADNSQAIDDTFGLSEEILTGLVRARILPWLRTTLVHYQARPPGPGETFKFWAGYGVISGLEGFPVDSLTVGTERDNSSTLDIGYFQKKLGPQQGPVNASVYGGVSRLDQTFRSGLDRTDNKWLAAVQMNFHEVDQSVILGGGFEPGGPSSHLWGLHGSLFKDQRNEWTTLCRVRRSLDSRDQVRKTEFCIVHIGLGDPRLAGRGRYVDFLGTFVPGMIKPTRIVNNSTLGENPNVPTVRSLTQRAKWNFVATQTDVEVTDQAGLRIESMEFYRSFLGQSFGDIFDDPYVGLSYMGTNSLYFDEQSVSLENTDIRREISLILGAAFGRRPGKWETEVRMGYDTRHREPVFRGSLHRFFGHR